MAATATASAAEIVEELKRLGGEGTKRVLENHGPGEAVVGVEVADPKKIQKRVKVNHQLALDLYDTGIRDARYLAGLIADDGKMTRKDLNRWVKHARGGLEGSTVPWVAAGSPHGREVALEWIESS